ncbi:MAG: hypothetical protein ACRETT_09740 [Steroidobacteraceae bacterium]
MKSTPIASRNPASPQKIAVVHLPVSVPQRLHSRSAANDERARGVFDNFKEPLWAIAFAMAIFFAVTAILIALG